MFDSQKIPLRSGPLHGAPINGRKYIGFTGVISPQEICALIWDPTYSPGDFGATPCRLAAGMLFPSTSGMASRDFWQYFSSSIQPHQNEALGVTILFDILCIYIYIQGLLAPQRPSWLIFYAAERMDDDTENLFKKMLNNLYLHCE